MRLCRYTFQRLNKHGVHVCLVEDGPKISQAVFMTGHGLKVEKIRGGEKLFIKDMEGSVPKAAKYFRKFAKTRGATKAALKLLKGV